MTFFAASRVLRFDVIKPFPINLDNRRRNALRIAAVETVLRSLVDVKALGARNRLPKPDRLRYLKPKGEARNMAPPSVHEPMTKRAHVRRVLGKQKQ
jgi:hypothetical protein